MDWTHEAEYVGFYAAQEQGYFRQAGLEVTLAEGPAGTDVPGALASGKVQAAQMGATMFQGAAHADPGLTAVFAVFQASPRVLLTRKELGVKGPKDLEGLKLGVKSASWAALVRQLVTNAGGDPKKLVEVPVKAGDVDRFYRGEVDVWTGFATDEPVDAALAGHPVNLLFADDYGVGGYDELLVVKGTDLQNNRDKYLRLVRALVQGWNWAVARDDEVASLLDRRQPGKSHEFHLAAWKALRPLVATGKDPIGWIRNDRWTVTGARFTDDLLGSQ